MTTFLVEPALRDTRKPLDPAAAALLKSFDGGALRFQRRAFLTEGDPLAPDRSQFVFQYTTGNGPRQQLVLDWSEPLERELLARGIAMEDREHEAARGGTLLLAALPHVDLVFGKAYTDAVLQALVHERFGSIRLIAALLWQAPHPVAHRSDAFDDCHRRLEQILDRYGNSLMLELRYSKREAYVILAGAVYFLYDKRNRITARKARSPTPGRL